MFAFLLLPFWDSYFFLITNEVYKKAALKTQENASKRSIVEYLLSEVKENL